MNILTFDIEEWALETAHAGGPRLNKLQEYDTILSWILDLLAKENLLATFFCTGKMAEEFPNVIKKIFANGHEIACHSYLHTWCNKMSLQQMEEDTHSAIDALEQCIGEKIKGYRAPAFSITEKNVGAFEILAKYGIEYDSSIFPAVRDFGGFPAFGYDTPTTITYNGLSLHEFPIPLMSIMGKRIAYSGGGYFRLFPLSIVQNEISKSSYAMTYFHIGDLLKEPKKMMSRQAYENYFKEPGTFTNRLKRYIKSNLAVGDTTTKLCQLIQNSDNKFIDIRQANQFIDWTNSPIKSLCTETILNV